MKQETKGKDISYGRRKPRTYKTFRVETSVGRFCIFKEPLVLVLKFL